MADEVGMDGESGSSAMPLDFWKDLLLQNRILWIALCALVFLLVSVFKSHYPIQNQFAKDAISTISRDLAQALFIAIILSLGIEAVARRELEGLVGSRLREYATTLSTGVSDLRRTADEKIDAISNEVFGAVLLRKFPDNIRAEIDTLILRSDFVREGYHTNYFLKICNNVLGDASGPKMMKVTAHATYRIKNIALETKNYDLRIFLEETPISGFTGYPRILEVRVDSKTLNLDQASFENSGGFIGFSHVIPGIKPDGSVEIMTRFEMIKFLDDYEIWTMTAPSDGMHVTMHFPPEVEQWDGFSIHRQDLTVIRNEPVGDLILKAPMLPKQGMVIWWRCSGAATSQHVPASPAAIPTP